MEIRMQVSLITFAVVPVPWIVNIRFMNRFNQLWSFLNILKQFWLHLEKGREKAVHSGLSSRHEIFLMKH